MIGKYLVAFILISSCFALGLPVDDQVQIGIPGYPHTIYSGYFDLNAHFTEKTIHYVYFESQSTPSKDPIIIWLAGGPGCSGMMNMMQENGPFVYRPGKKNIELNDKAWNKNAGLVYFQNPSGVGFSTGNNENKTITQQDAIDELVNTFNQFVNRHTSIKKNQFYFAGSGYGTVFATYLARRIVDQNKQDWRQEKDRIVIKGLLLGNPCVNPQECYSSSLNTNSIYHYQFLFKRGFLTHQQYARFQGACMMNYTQFSCYQLRNELDKFIQSTNTSIYNIYNRCYNNTVNQNSINLGCEDQTATINYFNDQTFRKNWNIVGDKKWEPCNKNVWLRYVQGNGTFHLLHQLATTDNVRIWVYSGDTDSSIPSIGTKNWINHYRSVYQVPTKKNWRQWWIRGLHTKLNQVGGFVWELTSLTFIVVKGAGFKAGADQPAAMDEVVDAFISNKPLPYKNDLKISQQ